MNTRFPDGRPLDITSLLDCLNVHVEHTDTIVNHLAFALKERIKNDPGACRVVDAIVEVVDFLAEDMDAFEYAIRERIESFDPGGKLEAAANAGG